MKRGRRARRQLRAAKPSPLVIRWRDGDLTLDARRVYSPAVRSLADAGRYVDLAKRVADLDLDEAEARRFGAMLALAMLGRALPRR